MPRKGDKVGDAYIEVHPELDNKALAKAHADTLKRVQKLEKDIDITVNRSRKKRAKDGGVLNVGESIENVLSILPGQLEKLFRSPEIAGAAAIAGGNLASLLISGFAGGLAIGAAGGGIAASLIASIKSNKGLEAAAKSLGATALSGLQEASKPLRGEYLAVLQDLQGETKKLFGNLDLTVLAPGIRSFEKGFTGFLDKAAPGLQTLLKTGSQFASVFETFGPALGTSFTDLANTIDKNSKDITDDLNSILGLVNATVKAVDVLVQLNSNAAFKAVTQGGSLQILGGLNSGDPKSINQSREAISRLANLFGGVVGGGVFDEFFDSWKKVPEGVAKAVPPLQQYGDALNATGRSLQEQAAAFDTAYAAQQKYDSALHSSLDGQIQVKQAVYDVNTALKANGKTLNINTQKGRDNFVAIETGFKKIKEGYQQQVTDGKLSADAAEKAFKRQTDAILKTAGATGTARSSLVNLRDDLNSFQTNYVAKVTLEGIAAAKANINDLKRQLAGIGTSAGQKKQAAAQLAKNRATGGAVFGPGTATSDSIPANLSNGEFVIKASSAKKIGYGTLNAMNASGRSPQGFATGGVAGQGRGKTKSQVAQFNALNVQISNLIKAINKETAILTKYAEAQNNAIQQFSQFVNLGNIDTTGKTAGKVLGEFLQRNRKAQDFAANIKSLRAKGLSEAALQQVVDAGPESDVARLLAQGLQPIDIQNINAILGGAGGYGKNIANALVPGGPGAAAGLAANKRSLAAKKKQAAKLKAPRARGATISYAGGKVSALFSSKELQEQQLRTGTYVTVMIDGKEVRAIVKQEQNKQTAKANRNLRAGRR